MVQILFRDEVMAVDVLHQVIAIDLNPLFEYVLDCIYNGFDGDGTILLLQWQSQLKYPCNHVYHAREHKTPSFYNIKNTLKMHCCCGLPLPTAGCTGVVLLRTACTEDLLSRTRPNRIEAN